MPGNIVKPSGCQTGECSLLGIGNPQRTTEWEKEPRTLQLPSILPTRGKARAGFRSSTPGNGHGGHWAQRSSQPPGSRRLVWKGGRLGIYGSLRPGSKEDTELSCTHVRAKLATATPPTPNSLPNSKNPALSPHSKTKHKALRCV